MNAVVIAIGSTEINTEHRLARESAESAIQHARRCGQLLLQKKSELQHGQFAEWVTANCEFSYRSARAYMRVAALQNETGSTLPLSSLRQALIQTEPATRWRAPRDKLAERERRQKLAKLMREDDPNFFVSYMKKKPKERRTKILILMIEKLGLTEEIQSVLQQSSARLRP